MLENVKVLAHSAIRITGEKTIYFDPFHLTEETHDAELIFVTHDHYDHLSPEDIARIAKADTLFVLPATCRESALEKGLPEEQLVTMEPGEKKTVGGLDVEAVPAYNVMKLFHTKGKKWLGYVVTLDGTRYYVAGDTDNNEDVRKVACDVALVPVGGTYTMTAKEAAALVNTIRPKAAVPTHYADIVGSEKDAKRFAGELDPAIVCEYCGGPAER